MQIHYYVNKFQHEIQMKIESKQSIAYAVPQCDIVMLVESQRDGTKNDDADILINVT